MVHYSSLKNSYHHSGCAETGRFQDTPVMFIGILSRGTWRDRSGRLCEYNIQGVFISEPGEADGRVIHYRRWYWRQLLTIVSFCCVGQLIRSHGNRTRLRQDGGAVAGELGRPNASRKRGTGLRSLWTSVKIWANPAIASHGNSLAPDRHENYSFYRPPWWRR